MSEAVDPSAVDDSVSKIDDAVSVGVMTATGGENLKRWLTEPQYAKYAAPLIAAVEDSRLHELDELFWEVIPFGTGGRRGLMADYGSATINARTIAESAHGLAVYLKQAKGESGGSAVIAHDTRHRSAEFSQITACTLAAHGLHVYYFDAHRSTPELSFAVRHLKCDVGVMITASHNPPSDNGFKAYWSSGAQVLPPHDKGIIDCVYNAGEIPQVDFDVALASGQIELIGDAVDEDYLSAVASLSLSDARDLHAIFTPLHGVGETSAFATLQRCGFDGVTVFEPQRTPDGDFPNVPDHLPNPERTEVFEPAIDVASRTDATLILGCDPDADRLGVVVRNAANEFMHLTGNQVAALLTDYVLGKRAAAGTLSPEHYVVETLVTTPMLGAIAKAYGVRVVDDLLVGFKYIAQTMDQEGPDKFVFGAEESLGYLAGQHCRDKDASVATLYACELAAELQQQGKTLLDRLDELHRQHGYFLEGQISKTCQGPSGSEQIRELMKQMTSQPPVQLGPAKLVRVRDYERNEIRALPSNTVSDELPAPSGKLLIFEAETPDVKLQVAVRPSGTEPKIKFYLFAEAPCDESADLDNIKSATKTVMNAVGEGLTSWIDRVLAIA